MTRSDKNTSPLKHRQGHKAAASLLPAAVLLVVLALLVAGGAWALRRPQPRGMPQSASLLAQAGQAWFDEVARQAGIDFRADSGQGAKLYMPEIMTGGVGWLDYDRDGYLDLYFVQGGKVVHPPPDVPPNRLYRNRGDGTFEDVTARSGTGNTGYGMGCTCGDYDDDGWVDIYVTNAGANTLLRNNGDGTFSDVTATAGVGDAGFGSSSAFVDYDRDGDLDLIVINYIDWSAERELDCVGTNGRRDYCSPVAYRAPARDRLYRNNGDGTFSDASDSAGLSATKGYGLGVTCADFNGDRFPDIAVANDMTPNRLWINGGNGTFRDEAVERTLAYDGSGRVEAGMGIDAQDVDNDGDYEVFMTHLDGQTNTLYKAESEVFDDQTTRFGLTTTMPYTGFGTALIDLNNDGLLDIYVANGRVTTAKNRSWTEDPFAEPNTLLQGVSGGTFREVYPQGGTDALLVHTSRGAAFGDYDNDGNVDIAVANRDAAPYLLRNRGFPGSHWLTVKVENRAGADAIGATVILEVDGRTLRRDVHPAYSYCSSNDPRVHFGLGKATGVDSLRVVWLDGTVESFGSYAVDQMVTIRHNSEP